MGILSCPVSRLCRRVETAFKESRAILKAKVGRIEKRVDLASKFKRVQLPGLSPLTPVRFSSSPKPLPAAWLSLILCF